MQQSASSRRHRAVVERAKKMYLIENKLNKKLEICAEKCAY